MDLPHAVGQVADHIPAESAVDTCSLAEGEAAAGEEAADDAVVHGPEAEEVGAGADGDPMDWGTPS